MTSGIREQPLQKTETPRSSNAGLINHTSPILNGMVTIYRLGLS